MIDPILDQDDKNKDGFIDYPEFIQAQQATGSAQWWAFPEIPILVPLSVHLNLLSWRNNEIDR